MAQPLINQTQSARKTIETVCYVLLLALLVFVITFFGLQISDGLRRERKRIDTVQRPISNTNVAKVQTLLRCKRCKPAKVFSTSASRDAEVRLGHQLIKLGTQLIKFDTIKFKNTELSQMHKTIELAMVDILSMVDIIRNLPEVEQKTTVALDNLIAYIDQILTKFGKLTKLVHTVRLLRKQKTQKTRKQKTASAFDNFFEYLDCINGTSTAINNLFEYVDCYVKKG